MHGYKSTSRTSRDLWLSGITLRPKSYRGRRIGQASSRVSRVGRLSFNCCTLFALPFTLHPSLRRLIASSFNRMAPSSSPAPASLSIKGQAIPIPTGLFINNQFVAGHGTPM